MKVIRLQENDMVLRTVDIIDSEFILSLRLNKELNKFLSSVDYNIQKQQDWISKYKIREKNKEEFYFIIENNKGSKYGTLRIYNINETDCTWGSFILSPKRPANFSYKSAELSFEFVFKNLGLNTIKLDVNRNNSKAIYIYSKLGFEEYCSDEENIYMKLIKSKYEKNRWRRI